MNLRKGLVLDANILLRAVFGTRVRIPTKAITHSDLIPITRSGRC